jgi:hypothetical protein
VGWNSAGLVDKSGWSSREDYVTARTLEKTGRLKVYDGSAAVVKQFPTTCPWVYK